MTNRPNGYALLISVLVFGIMLITIATATAFSIARVQIREAGWESGLRAQALAEGCAEYGLLQLRLNGAYTGNENVTIDGSPCTIRPILLGVTTTLETEATVDNRHYRLRVQIDPATTTVVSWRRVVTF